MMGHNRQAAHGGRVGPMIIAVDPYFILAADHHFKQFTNILEDSLRIGTAVDQFQLGSLLLLLFGHFSASAHLAVGEVDEEVGFLLGCNVMVEGEVL